MNSHKKIAVVTGANRGLGFETTRQLATQGIHVVLTSRDETKGKAAVEKLQAAGLDVVYHPLDVTNPESIQQLAEFLRQEYGHVDVLVNNAGILPDTNEPDAESVLTVKVDTLHKTLETNVYGPLQLSQALVGLMKAHGYGRIVNVSSGMGQLSDMTGGYPSYRMSKTALNAITRMLSAELQGTNILVNSVCPGWVKIDMGGSQAPRTPEQGAETITWLATLPDDGPTGGFFQDKQRIPW